MLPFQGEERYCFLFPRILPGDKISCHFVAIAIITFNKGLHQKIRAESPNHLNPEATPRGVKHNVSESP